MPVLNIKRFQQKNACTCGAACAQMILYFLKKGRYNQADLFNEIRAVKARNKDQWLSSPQGITKVLNKHKSPDKKAGNFKLYKDKSGENLTNKITGFISRFKVPCIALVETGDHWIVVNGYHTKSEIRNATMAGGPDQLIDLWYNDPINIDVPNPKLFTQGNIDLHRWLHGYIFNRYRLPGIFKGKCVAICDPLSEDEKDEESEKGEKEPAESNVPSKQPYQSFYMPRKYQPFIQKPLENVIPASGKKIVHPKTVVKYTSHVVKDRGFGQVKFLKKSLYNNYTGKPVLVKQLNRKNGFYYIVPLHNPKTDVCALVMMGAYRCEYRESSFATNPKMKISFKPLNKKDIINVLKEALEKNKIKVNFPISMSKLSVQKQLVWKNCLESHSPFLPFYVVSLGIHKFYIRIDKVVFRKLTTNISGA